MTVKDGTIANFIFQICVHEERLLGLKPGATTKTFICALQITGLDIYWVNNRTKRIEETMVQAYNISNAAICSNSLPACSRINK